MKTQAVIRKNAYFDSVTLMAISKKIEGIDGVVNAMVSMGTDMNKELLQNAGLMTEVVEKAKPSDLIIAFQVVDESISEKVLDDIEETLKKKSSSSKGESEVAPASINSAIKILPEVNIAVVSLPGQYAAKEAMRALKNGLHVMLFSDNVSIEEEVELKKYAHEQGLLLMGPDCGTAILNNVGLCFANEVRAGSIGVVGASGTGTQEITVLIDRFGGGVSQVIGTGGRDLTEEVGGIMMCDALAALNADEETSVIVLISKPPVKSVADKVIAEAGKCTKPVVICFINSDAQTAEGTEIYFEGTLEGAARKAVNLSGDVPNKVEEQEADYHTYSDMINEFQESRTFEQQYVRGLFCGGTLCDEAMYIFKDSIQDSNANVYCNVAKKAEEKLVDPYQSVEHSFVDLGDDNFTVGKPHPMIDPGLRNSRILQEAMDPTVAVILVDVVLGYGSHTDPAGVTVTAIKEAKAIAEKENRSICFIAYVCGTEKDVQNFTLQEAKLAAEGVILTKSNAKAARLAALIVGGEKL
ncbi:acyl-CoA synthetase FdrA [Brevibacillus sp. SYSU BS000544]|uniref:acyl-CoA synthetase FdrA n=1 Tax=Brevibacillus sp. SYSU BS000544 TaxID=3416443 RepID=UPI003CE545FD